MRKQVENDYECFYGVDGKNLLFSTVSDVEWQNHEGHHWSGLCGAGWGFAAVA